MQSKVRVDEGVIKTDIWDHLESENFAFRSLVTLESLQLLEGYLWPGYTADSSNYHVLLLVLLVGVKGRKGLPAWGKLSDNERIVGALDHSC